MARNPKSKQDNPDHLFLQCLVEVKRFLAAVFRRRDAIGYAAHPVVEHRRVNEPGPDVQGFNEVLGQTAKAPGVRAKSLWSNPS
jgi:hypothetical protein